MGHTGKAGGRWTVPLAAGAALVAAFVAIAVAVPTGVTLPADKAVLLALRDPADAARPLFPSWAITMRDLTTLGGLTVRVILAVLAVGFLAFARKPAAAALVLAAVGGGEAVSRMLKDAFARARPDIVEHGTHVFTNSFPSSHAMLSAATYLTLGILLSRYVPGRAARAYVIAASSALVLSIGFSRLYLGVHYPTDVLAGWALGTGWALLCLAAERALAGRGAIEPPRA